MTTACRNGYTLVYDEFSRSRPEANNVLLTVLEEGILALPQSYYGDSYMRVHPEFRAIFTSNPEEYAGVHKTQNALMDRMITVELGHHDRETEVAITCARAGIDEAWAETIVDLVQSFRDRGGVDTGRPSIRACIMIGKVLRLRGASARPDDPVFLEICLDVLGSDMVKVRRQGTSVAAEEVRRLVEELA